MTIADRLEALSAAVDHEAERAWADKGSRVALAGAGGGEGGAVQPRAESLSTVLTQVSLVWAVRLAFGLCLAFS